MYVSFLYSDSSVLSAGEVMQYLTGSKRIPPLGLPPSIRVYFKHGCSVSHAGTACQCLPVISTCAMTISLPPYSDKIIIFSLLI